MALYPLVLLKVKTYVPLALPLDGVTETTNGLVVEPGMFQLPAACQPELPLELLADIYVVLVPANVEEKVILIAIEIVLPLAKMELPEPLIVH